MTLYLFFIFLSFPLDSAKLNSKGIEGAPLFLTFVRLKSYRHKYPILNFKEKNLPFRFPLMIHRLSLFFKNPRKLNLSA